MKVGQLAGCFAVRHHYFVACLTMMFEKSRWKFYILEFKSVVHMSQCGLDTFFDTIVKDNRRAGTHCHH